MITGWVYMITPTHCNMTIMYTLSLNLFTNILKFYCTNKYLLSSWILALAANSSSPADKMFHVTVFGRSLQVTVRIKTEAGISTKLPR